MKSRPPVWLLLAAVLVLPAHAREHNGWPLQVAQEDEQTGEITAEQGLGPLIAEHQSPDGTHTRLLRPLFLHSAKGPQETVHFLYPLITWQRDGATSYFTFFQLLNNRRTPGAQGRLEHGLDVWPLYFSRDTGDPDSTYHAFLPVAGTIKYRFGKDRLSWTAFPLHFRVEKSGRRTTYAPWPFLRFTEGAGHHGFEFWPLYGQVARDHDYRNQYYLWPLIYKQERHLDEPAGALSTSLGFLPFYTRDTAPGYLNESYLWPFFGYTDRTSPRRYHETRYLWPLLVQGRGDDRTINRWAPLYTHSIVKGYDKTWLLWPLYRHARWQEQGLAQERDQFLFFLYWSHEQRSLAHPAAKPAYKKHLWPLFSVWDNGAGRRQLQLLSPLEVFFPNNQPIRELYSPLFSLYRYDQRAPDDLRWSFLWNLVSRRRSATEREFHLGPLFSTRAATATGERVAIGNGLLSWRRAPGERRWRFSVFDFRRTVDTTAPTATTP